MSQEDLLDGFQRAMREENFSSNGKNEQNGGKAHERDVADVRAMLQSEWVAVEMESGGVDGGGSSGGGSSGGVSNYLREECQCRIA